MKKLKWYLLSSLIPLFFPVFIIIIIMGAVGGGSTGGSSQSLNGATYTQILPLQRTLNLIRFQHLVW